MAKMHSRRRGKSGSKKPASTTAPAWVTYKPVEVEALVVKLAKQGNGPSMIGLILRDNYGIPLARSISGKKVSQLLRQNQASPSIPEDLQVLVQKAKDLAKHLQRNKQDFVNKHSMALVESKIHRLTKYYKSEGLLPQDWKYVHAVASVE